jgi:pentose-5-phosphate-3-epimerase
MGVQTKLKLEAHMMTFRPERYFSDLTVAGVSRVLLHREAYDSLEACVADLRHAADYFAEVGLVINPDTAVEKYHELPIQSLQVMGIHPGMSGQPFLADAHATIASVAAQKLGIPLAVDGGVHEDNIQELQAEGVTRFIMTSRLFATPNIVPSLQYFIQLVQGGA